MDIENPTAQAIDQYSDDQKRTAAAGCSISATDAAVAAIRFALEDDEDPMGFLRCWNEGNFDAIRREWPDAPEAVFIGADPLHPETARLLGLDEDARSGPAALDEIGTLLGIGKDARTMGIILGNIENMMRRSECLRAVEREFFTVTKTYDADDCEPGDEGTEYEECLLNWGADPSEYVEQFRAALAAAPKPSQQALIDPASLLPAERDCCGTFPRTRHRSTCKHYRGKVAAQKPDGE